MTATSAETAAASADLVLHNGPVLTMTGQRSDAIALGAHRVLGLGAEVAPLIGRRTEVVNLHGRAVLPGFHDAHVHPIYGGLTRLRCDLSDEAPGADAGVDDYLGRIAEHVRTHRESDWVLGGGWEATRLPDAEPRALLDLVTGPRPAFLVSADHHSAWVNTAALATAGIDRRTPDPPDGRIARTVAGDPSGLLHDGAAELVGRRLPGSSAEEYRAALREGQRHLHSCGVTSWHDAILGAYLGYRDTLPTYLELTEAGELTGRASGALWWDTTRGTEQLADLLARRDSAREHGFRAESVKIMLDGVCENRTAALLAPYADHPGRGHGRVDADALREIVTALVARNFQVHFHAIGDRAVRDALDAVEHAQRATGRADLRHHLAHAQLIDPADLARLVELDVVVNMQMLWAMADPAMTELTVPALGPHRTAQQYPFASLLNRGARCCAGSDWPVSSAHPMHAVHTAVNRIGPEMDTAAFLPEQAIGVAQALAALTSGSAWAHHVDDRLGTLTPGALADFVVLDRDPLAVPTRELGGIAVEATFVGGAPVHSRW